MTKRSRKFWARMFPGKKSRDGWPELRRVNRMMVELGPHGLLLPAEAATLLRVSINRLYELLIPKVRIGRRVRYQVKHLQHYLNDNTEDPWRHIDSRRSSGRAPVYDHEEARRLINESRGRK